MDIRTLTPAYSVTPQIEPADIPAIADAGFRTIICNRPDAEVPPPLQAQAIQTAAEAAGLNFVVMPATHQTIDADFAERQKAVVETGPGPVLAYCASGTRCTVLWLFGHAAETDPDALLETAAKAGYQLPQLRPQLAALHQG